MVNATLEERVTFLEFQMLEVNEEIQDIGGEVDFLFTEQIIQDARIYDVEEEVESEILFLFANQCWPVLIEQPSYFYLKHLAPLLLVGRHSIYSKVDEPSYALKLCPTRKIFLNSYLRKFYLLLFPCR